MTMAAFIGGVLAGIALAYGKRLRSVRVGRRSSGDATADALAPLAAQGWRTLANARLGRTGEIDHLAIGPAGVLLVETKWRREAPTERDLHAALRQVRHNLRELRAALGDALCDVPVQGVVVVWGPHEGLEPTTYHDGVLVIAGDHLAAWLETLSGAHLSQAAVAALHERVRHGVTADRRDEPTGPVRLLPTRVQAA